MAIIVTERFTNIEFAYRFLYAENMHISAVLTGMVDFILLHTFLLKTLLLRKFTIFPQK